MKATILKADDGNIIFSLQNGNTLIMQKEKITFSYPYSIGDTVALKETKGSYICSLDKKRNKKNLIMLFVSLACVFIIVLILTIVIFVLPNFKNNPEQADNRDMRQELNSCLDSVSLTTSSGSSLYYASMRSCYEKYEVEESESKIQEYRNEENRLATLNSCLNDAIRDYSVSDEEIDSAGSITRLTELMQRINNGYSVRISCYEAYGNGNYESEISELKQKIAYNIELLHSAGNYNYDYTYNYEVPSYDYSAGNNDVPTDNNYYNAPTPEEVTPPVYTPSCDEYHSQYYSAYQQTITSIYSYYDSAIADAHNTCISQHGSFGGCPQASRLERERDSKVLQAKSSYKSNMSSAGCDPSSYVDF